MTAQPCPTLYILMRTDMASLNYGKAMAQAAHAANVFTYNFADSDLEGFAKWVGDDNVYDLHDAAPGQFIQSKGAGTTITLAVGSEKELIEIVQAARDDGYAAALYRDISYPIRDGSVTHMLPVITCGYVFSPCRHNMRPSCTTGLPLHP